MATHLLFILMVRTSLVGAGGDGGLVSLCCDLSSTCGKIDVTRGPDEGGEKR